MGIPNFSSFVNNIDGLRKSSQLSNTYVVVDGSNFLHYLYIQFKDKQNPNDFLFGGNYTDYRLFFTKLFLNLKKCEIIPIIVFDGGLNPNLKESRRGRFEQTFSKSRIISENPPECLSTYKPSQDIIFPFLLSDSMKSVIRELDIHCIQTILDADLETAKLANHLKCPLISSDTDFLIMPINEGVITCDSFQWQTPLKSKESKTHYIECKVYRLNNFVDKFGLKPEMLPIFATLMGNDGIDNKVFEDLFTDIRNEIRNQYIAQESSSSESSDISDTLEVSVRKNRWLLMNQLLYWLSHKFFSANQAKAFIEKYLNQKQIDSKDYKLSIESYETGGKCYLVDVLKPKLEKTDENDIKSRIDEIVGETRLPKWFLNEYFLKPNFGAIYFTFIDTKVFNLRPLIEDIKLESCYDSSQPLYAILLGLLRLKGNDRTPLTITTRKGYDVDERVLRPITHITHTPSGDRGLPLLADIRKLSDNERKSLLFDILRFDEKWFTDFEEDLLLIKMDRQDIDFWKYFLVVMKYWKLNTRVKTYYFEFIRAMVYSIIYYRHKSLCKDFDGLKVILKTSKEGEEWRLTEESLKPFITHYYNEFQSIYSIINKLMSLLGDPIPRSELHNSLNGVLYYKLFNEMIAKRVKLWPFKEYRLNTITNFIIGAICKE